MIGGLVLTAASLTIATGAVKHREALRLLRLLKQVDGAGSGLDADTVRGVTPLVVVDVDGNFVGMWVGGVQEGNIVRRLDGNPVDIVVTRDGFEEAGAFYFESADCTGDRLMSFSSDMMPDHASIVGHVAYYPLSPAVHTVNSSASTPFTESSCVGGSFIPPDVCCYHFPPAVIGLGTATPFDLDSLGLTPPFHLAVP